MKKNIDLKTIALMGIAGSAVISLLQADQEINRGKPGQSNVRLNPKFESSPMHEKELLSLLTAEARKEYDKLSEEGKLLVLNLAGQPVRTKNSCAGLNSCSSTAKSSGCGPHSCSGQAALPGISSGYFADKSLAVAVVSRYAKNRQALLN